MSINSRIKEVRTSLKLSREAFAEKLRCSPFVIRNVEYENNEPKQMLIDQICDVYNVSETWLKTGEGEMFVEQGTEDVIIEAFGKLINADDTSFAKQFVAVLAELEPDEWDVIEKFAWAVVERQREAIEKSKGGEE